MNSPSTQFVYAFQEGSAAMRALLGGKGANLAEMTRIGLPVPPGFTVSTETCRQYVSGGCRLPAGAWEQVEAALAKLQTQMGKRLGDVEDPLLVSVRSGAAVSMPGMMDTVLNLGLTHKSLVGLVAKTGNERFAWDCFRRFIQMFSNVVLGLQMHHFELLLTAKRGRYGAKTDADIPAKGLQELVAEYEAEVLRQSGKPFPDDPLTQLQASVCAVFDSWDNPRAKVYRDLHKIPHDMGTAVNVQAMVFGNMGDTSATGVAFTRDPNSGAPEFYGEYLINAQGEDVVAGIRTPQKIDKLSESLPEAYQQLFETCQLLEKHYGDMQDIEFTVERGKLWMLQCRSGKRAPTATIRIAVDLCKEGKITKNQAILRVDPETLQKSMHTRFEAQAQIDLLTQGQPASPGAVAGKICFDSDRAVELAKAGERVILVRPETTPDDIHGMVASGGFVTTRGGTTCHAAIVARGMGKPCVVGCDALFIDEAAGTFTVGSRVVREGELISIDGGDGRIGYGQVSIVQAGLSDEFRTLLSWADEVRRLKVRANADNPMDAERARNFGAEGIGLCRTEHMFGQGGHHPERMAAVQEMILADQEPERIAALNVLAPMQEEDFVGIFRAMNGLPVTIRLLDPPLHEFLPSDKDIAELELSQPDKAAALRKKKKQMHETNPMLGFRGVRLGIIHPEIYAMQVRAIFAAAQQVHREGGKVLPEIMIPLVGHVEELRLMRQMTLDIAAEMQVTVPYMIGTMIEVPRAALTADDIAGEAEFFSFGTNDLTQTTYGYSRDDAEGGFLGQYVTQKVLPENPFVTLDRGGVGKLLKMSLELGRKVRPKIKLGICGEHGGDPESIHFCHEIGLDYVSCSPFRVPVARLSAAQAELKGRGEKASASSV